MNRLTHAEQVLAQAVERDAAAEVPATVTSPMDEHSTVSVQQALIDDCERAAARGVHPPKSASERKVEPHSA